MEDKWFAYFDEPYLYLHRSWGGMAVFRVKLEADGDGARVTEALCETRALAKFTGESSAAMLGFVIAALLLGEDVAFPMPADAASTVKGLLQHSVAGTGRRETVVPPARIVSRPPPRRPWWRFWG